MKKNISSDPNLIAAFKALSNNTRLQILDWLKQPERHFPGQEVGDVGVVGVCVKLLQSKAGLSQSTVSQYLAELESTGFVIATRQGQWTYYKRNEKGIASLAAHIKHNL